MTWGRLDDGFWCHRKTIAAGAAGVAFWTLAVSYCNKHLTDGWLDSTDISNLWRFETPTAAEAVGAAVAAGLVDAHGERWCIHDFLDKNPSREEVLAKRAAEAKRQRERRMRTAGVPAPPASVSRTYAQRDTGSDNVADYDGDSTRDHVADSSRDAARTTRVPTEPDRIFSSEGDQIHSPPDHSIPGARVTTRVTEDDVLTLRERRAGEARSILIRAYGEHWGRPENANDLWPGPGPSDKWVRHVAANYLAKQGDMEAAAEEVMLGFFADEWARGARWPWGQLAKDPGKYRGVVKGRSNERAVAEYEAAAKARDEAYRKGEHAEGQRLEGVVKEKHERAFRSAAR